MLKFKSHIFYQFSCTFFFFFFIYIYIYIKIPKYLSAKYYQENKERLQKSSWKILKSF